MTFYDLLLRLYPASFRNEYGGEMRAVFARERRRASGLAVPALWIRTIPDVVVNSAGAHLDILAQDLSYTAADAEPGPGVRGDGGPDRGPRHRRDDRRVHGHRLRAVPAAAVPRTRTARQALGADPRLLADGAVGAELSRLARGIAVVPLDGDVPRHRGDADRRRRTAPAVRRCRQRRSLSDARRRAAPRARLHSRRRSPRRRRDRHPQLSLLAVRVRRRPGNRRQEPAIRRHAAHRHRRDAARVPLPGERRPVLDADLVRRGGLRRYAAHQQLARGRRPVASRRDAGTGAGRDECRGGAVRGPLPDREQGHRRVGGCARRRDLRSVAHAAGDAARRRGLRAAHRLRQPREPAAGARARPAPRAGGPHGDRRRPRAHRPPADDREPGARRRRRRARGRPGDRRGADAVAAGAADAAAGGGADGGRPSHAGRRRPDGADRSRLRRRAGAAQRRRAGPRRPA